MLKHYQLRTANKTEKHRKYQYLGVSCIVSLPAKFYVAFNDYGYLKE
jgi:hypothetical protein